MRIAKQIILVVLVILFSSCSIFQLTEEYANYKIEKILIDSSNNRDISYSQFSLETIETENARTRVMKAVLNYFDKD